MNNFDMILENALQPTAEPSKELNKAILQGAYEGRGKKRNIFGGIPKVAVAALALVLACPMGVYAAKTILKQVYVTEHMVSVGNEELIDDAAVTESMKHDKVAEELVSSEEGDGTVKWLRKEVKKINGTATNTFCYYNNFADAMADSGLENWLGGTYEAAGEAVYTHTEDPEFVEDTVDASFVSGDGSFDFYTSKMTGNVESDVSVSLYTGKTSNKRSYVSGAGHEFTLVDNVKEEEGTSVTTTYVVVSYGENFGYLGFKGMTEEEIKKVLDAVQISGE